ncbi:MAG: hypothetical protein ACRD0Q_00985 [Acidimicrobiales bacterium]
MLTRGERIVAVAGTLLLVDLIALPWHRTTFAPSVVGVLEISRTGVQRPNAGLGLLALLAAAAMVTQVVATKVAGASLPEIPVPWAQVHLVAGWAAVALLVLKLMAAPERLGSGAWLGLALAGALAYGGVTVNREARNPDR